MPSEPDDFTDDAIGMAEYADSFPDDHGALCAACGREAFGLLCESCSGAVDRLGVR